MAKGNNAVLRHKRNLLVYGTEGREGMKKEKGNLKIT